MASSFVSNFEHAFGSGVSPMDTRRIDGRDRGAGGWRGGAFPMIKSMSMVVLLR